MRRRITANRERLNLRQLHLDGDGYLYAGPLKVARFVPERMTLEFAARRSDRNAGQPRMVEVDVSEFLEILKGRG